MLLAGGIIRRRRASCSSWKSFPLLWVERKDAEGAEPWLIHVGWRTFETRNWLGSPVVWVIFLPKQGKSGGKCTEMVGMAHQPIVTAGAMGKQQQETSWRLAREPRPCSEAPASLEMQYIAGLQEPQE